MRDPNRLYNFYSELTRIHVTHFPDWRFGQFMCNFLGWIKFSTGRDPFFIEEPVLLDLLYKYAKEN